MDSVTFSACLLQVNVSVYNQLVRPTALRCSLRSASVLGCYKMPPPRSRLTQHSWSMGVSEYLPKFLGNDDASWYSNAVVARKAPSLERKQTVVQTMVRHNHGRADTEADRTNIARYQVGLHVSLRATRYVHCDYQFFPYRLGNFAKAEQKPTVFCSSQWSSDFSRLLPII